MSLFEKTTSGLIVSKNELEIAKRKSKLVYEGSNLDQEKQRDNFNEYARKVQEQVDKALTAPTPRIKFLDNKVLLRAVPINTRTTSAGIITTNYDNLNDDIIKDITKTEGQVSFVQEVLVIGEMAKENYPSLKVGSMVRINENNFIAGRGTSGYENELFYNIPTHYIKGHKYVVIQAHEILYVELEDEVTEE